jgi:hypothetical protein
VVNSICTLTETTISNIQIVYLENETMRVSILVGKGADVYEMIYKPLHMDVLVKTNQGLDVFKDRNLSEKRLKMYSELYAGGWQDCLPHRGRYEDIDITQETGGIAATIPWEYEIFENTDQGVGIRCFVRLQEIPMYIEKTFLLKQGQSKLTMDVRIRNEGASVLKFTWTQHAVFGGQFLDEHVSIEVPECAVFQPRTYDRSIKSDLSDYEEPIDHVTLPNGKVRNLQTVLPRNSNEQFFAVLKNIREPWARLINRKKKVGVQLLWDLAAYPFIRFLCNNTETSYGIGIEPSNDAFVSFDDSLDHGTFRELQPAGEYATSIVCDIFEIV